MQIHYILGVLLVVYIAQAVLSLLQIQQIYRIIEQQKQTYQGKGYTLAVGNSFHSGKDGKTFQQMEVLNYLSLINDENKDDAF